MRTAIAFTLVSFFILPMVANASVCHQLADHAEEMMRQHQFPGERSRYDVHEFARRTRDPQFVEFVDNLQRLVWSRDRYVTEDRKIEAVHSFSQEIYDLCSSSE